MEKISGYMKQIITALVLFIFYLFIQYTIYDKLCTWFSLRFFWVPIWTLLVTLLHCLFEDDADRKTINSVILGIVGILIVVYYLIYFDLDKVYYCFAVMVAIALNYLLTTSGLKLATFIEEKISN